MTVFNPGYRKGGMECVCTLEIKAMIFFYLNGKRRFDILFEFEGPTVFKGLHLDRNLTKLLEIIYPRFLEPHAHPLGHGLCSKPPLIEIDGGLIPLQHGKTILVADPLCPFSSCNKLTLRTDQSSHAQFWEQ